MLVTIFQERLPIIIRRNGDRHFSENIQFGLKYSKAHIKVPKVGQHFQTKIAYKTCCMIQYLDGLA